MTERVRDAMVREPRALLATASAQTAGEILARPEVRAVYVVDDDGRIVGVVTRKTLVRAVVAPGLDPRTTVLTEIAEAPHYTLAPALPLEQAFRFMEEHDAERVPVVEDDGRLIGVLSRAVLQRRLAEEREEEESPELPPAA